MTTLEARGNLWILDEYGLDRDWLHPKTENVFMWPQKSIRQNINQQMESFAKDDRRHILGRAARIAAKISAKDLEKFSHIQLRVWQNDSHFYIPCLVTKDADRLGFDDETEIYDAGSIRTRLESQTWDRVVRLSFCSLRFDETQHVILVLDGVRVVDEVWTVEEVHVETTRIFPNQIRFLMRRAVFLFDRSQPLLNRDAQRDVRLKCRLAFGRALPDDIVNLVAEKVIEDSDGLTLRRFISGDAVGTFHYVIARLLRVGWHAGMKVPSLHEYAKMDDCSRRQVQPIFNSIIRRRHAFFARKLSNKTTRSGHVY